MKILMIPSYFKNKRNESMGSFFLDQAILMRQFGHEVTLLYPDTYSLKYIKDYLNYQEVDEEINGVKIVRSKFLSIFKHGFLKNKKCFAKGASQIVQKKLDNHFDFDIIHAHNCVWAGEAARVLSQEYHVPYIITEHASLFSDYNNHLRKKVEKDIKVILNHSSANICVSSQLQKDLKRYINHCTVIGNVVDMDAFQILNHIQKSDNDSFVFVSISYLQSDKRIKWKGIDLLLESFKKVLQINPTVKLKIIGVPENSYLHEMVRELGIEKNVILMPVISDREELCKQLNMSDCFVLPSQYETFGLVYAEAMCCGLPVIATNVGIASQIINEETGVLCERTKESLLQAMLYVYDNKKNYKKTIIRKNIENKFSKSSICNQISKVYLDVINRK